MNGKVFLVSPAGGRVSYVKRPVVEMVEPLAVVAMTRPVKKDQGYVPQSSGGSKASRLIEKRFEGMSFVEKVLAIAKEDRQ